MSPFSGTIIFSITICYIYLTSVGVSSIYISEFINNNYARICNNNSGYDIDSVCRVIASLKYMNAGVYSNSNNITGSCESLSVDVQSDNTGQMVARDYNIVKCDLGPSLTKCASAAAQDNYAKYYDYTFKEGLWRCMIMGAVKIA